MLTQNFKPVLVMLLGATLALSVWFLVFGSPSIADEKGPYKVLSVRDIGSAGDFEQTLNTLSKDGYEYVGSAIQHSGATTTYAVLRKRK